MCSTMSILFVRLAALIYYWGHVLLKNHITLLATFFEGFRTMQYCFIILFLCIFVVHDFVVPHSNNIIVNFLSSHPIYIYIYKYDTHFQLRDTEDIKAVPHGCAAELINKIHVLRIWRDFELLNWYQDDHGNWIEHDSQHCLAQYVGATLYVMLSTSLLMSFGVIFKLQAHLPPPSSDTIILMCGPPPMVKFACEANLEKLGYAKDSCLAFWNKPTLSADALFENILFPRIVFSLSMVNDLVSKGGWPGFCSLGKTWLLYTDHDREDTQARPVKHARGSKTIRYWTESLVVNWITCMIWQQVFQRLFAFSAKAVCVPF